MMGRGGMRGPPPMYGQGGPMSNAPSAYGGSTYVEDAPAAMGGASRGADGEQGPIGQAVEMDERSGLPSPTLKQTFGLRDSDLDVQGMIGMQQQRRSNDVQSSSSVYGEEYVIANPVSRLFSRTNKTSRSYVPARSNWQKPSMGTSSSSSMPTTSSSIQTPHTGSSGVGRALSPIAHSPVGDMSPGYPNRPNPQSADSYYEDPDPTFAAASSPPRNPAGPAGAGALPASLMAGGGPGPSGNTPLAPGPAARAAMSPPPRLQTTDGGALMAPQAAILDRNSSSSSLPEGARSPTASETSHYTSVSQRGINPNWDGPRVSPLSLQQQQQQARGGGRMGGGPGREEVLLGGNPDFSLPGMGSPRGGLAGTGLRGGGFRGRGGSGMGRGGGGAGYGMTPNTRYPDAI
jgi:hypothetical protein